MARMPLAQDDRTRACPIARSATESVNGEQQGGETSAERCRPRRSGRGTAIEAAATTDVSGIQCALLEYREDGGIR